MSSPSHNPDATPSSIDGLEHHAYRIDGKHYAQIIKERVAKQVTYLAENHRLKPGLAVVMVGENPASAIYVRNKIKACEEVGISSFEYHLESSISERNLFSKIQHLNNDIKTHGILVQLPLPSHCNAFSVIDTIHPDKDVDGFHVDNIGRLVIGNTEGFVPCTPLGCSMLLDHLVQENIISTLSGLKAVIVGRSNIVGKPMASLLLNRDCTVTMLHSRSQNIDVEIGQADIIIAAVGIPNYIQGEWIKPGAIVIDVGINRTTKNGIPVIVGDVDYDTASSRALAITPVPGGVGPMTIACLLYNTVKAACLQRRISLPEELIF